MRAAFFLCLVVALSSANALHFYLTEGTEKCLTDDIPASTVRHKNNIKKKKN